MKTIKTIEKIFSPPAPHMVGDGFRVHNFFPGNNLMSIERMSPFFLMDYGAKFYFPPSDKPRGVGVHPHRGFETVTLAYKGKVAHHDSAGNSGVIGEGDVQWMTAASGILHKEYHEKEWSKTGGEFQMVQLWVNLPAKDKMSPPKYQALERKQFGKYLLKDDGGVVEVIAGQYNDIKGPANTFTPIHVYNVRLNKNGKETFSLPANFNTACVVIDGNVQVNDSLAKTNQLVLFENTGTDFQIEAIDDAIVLVLSGQPINEPIVSFGPFLMNTKQEIQQAYNDLNNGKFGYLED